MVALLATAVIAGVRIALREPIGEKLQFTPFTLSVVAAATWGGLGPGLVATLAGALAEMWAVVPTEFSVSRAGLPDWADAAMFLAIGAAISWLCESVHAGRRRSERERRRMEQNVEKRLAAERALSESETASHERLIELQSVYAATPIGMLQLDAELRCVRASDRAAEIYGSSELAHAGRPMREILPGLGGRLEAVARTVLETGEPALDLVLTVGVASDPGGSRSWVQSVYPVRDSLGEVVGVNVVAQEITHRMRAEREAHESEARFRALVEAVSSTVWVADSAGDFRGPQESWTRYTGQAPEEQTGQGWTAAIHPEDRERFLERWREALRTGSILRTSARLLHASGEYRRAEATVVPVRDPDGSTREWIGKFLNVEDRMRAEDGLARVSEELRIVTESMAAPVTRCTRDLRYRWVSRPYAEWLRLRPEEIVGQSIEEVIGPEAMKALLPRFEAVLAGEVVRYEEEVDFRGIGKRWIRAVYTPTRDASGSVDGWVAVVVDIHALKQAEEELRDSHARKERFLATLAHELRNPLAPLRNSLEILKQPNVTPEIARQARAAMERQLSHAVRLVDDLLDLSRINRDTLELRLEKCDLRSVVEQAIETARPHLDAGAHDLSVELPATPLWLRADPIRLAQVFANLLHNACKFSDRGSRIALAATKETGWITVVVRDEGIGFPPEMGEKIFEMFVQLDPGPSRAVGGLGVGLSLVRRLAELHGGRVEASSEGPGRGAEFRVVLPEFAAASDAPSAFLRSARPRAGAMRRILVVDDNPDSAASLSTLLALSGNETRVAHDGVEAVSETEAFRPDVVLLDIGMPRMDGYEAARRIRALPNGRDVLLVAVSGWGQQEDRRRSREAGFDHHMVKPLRAAALETLLAGAPSPRSGTEEAGVR